MRTHRLLAVLLLFVTATAICADDHRTRFSRIAKNDDGQPVALQLAVVTYAAAGDSDVRVDLVSAVHVGDAAYYALLNERFKSYDALLYELVAPAGTVITPDVKPAGFVSGMQRAMTSVLDLSFQLEAIDYTQANFVHADLTPQEMSQSMAERNESLYVYFWQMVYAALREYGRDPLGMRNLEAMGASMASGRKSHPFKIMLAYEFANVDRFQGMLGNDADSAIIGARNERAIDVLQREIRNGATRLGIFYGLAHMRDLENRMLDIGFVPVETNWIDAWAL